MILQSRERKYLAACNEIAWLSKPLQSRFRRLHLPPYTEEQFLEVSARVLPKLKIAHLIGKAVWDQRGDIRDVIYQGHKYYYNDRSWSHRGDITTRQHNMTLIPPGGVWVGLV